MFFQQTHPDSKLLVFDDLGNVKPASFKADSKEATIISVQKRSRSLPSKYNNMLAISKVLWPNDRFDGIVIWDDDDVYLPNHLLVHAVMLHNHAVSYHPKVWSTYTGTPELEDSGGRFWASSAVRFDHFQQRGGFVQTANADFDTQSLGVWIKDVTLPKYANLPTYVFRWADTQASHCQGLMTSPTDTTWYGRNKPGYTESIQCRPELDEVTKDVLLTTIAKASSAPSI